MVTVYPRVCGGTYALRLVALAVSGLSPRVRGNLPRCARAGIGSRSIPACAGEPTTREMLDDMLMVYPRVCGGTLGIVSFFAEMDGLSPRVRGNQVYAVHAG